MAKDIKINYRPWNPIPVIFGILSVMVSYHFNQSILWAIFHWIFSIPYLIYSLIIGRFADGGFMEIINSYF